MPGRPLRYLLPTAALVLGAALAVRGALQIDSPPERVTTTTAAAAMERPLAAGSTIISAGVLPVTLEAFGRAEARNLLASEASTTYLPEMLLQRDSSLTRWPRRIDKPLDVWVQPFAATEGTPRSHSAQVHRAFDEWAAAGIPLRFVFAGDSADADVHVVWVNRFDEPISGKTMWIHNEHGWILGGRITLATHHSDGQPLDTAAVHAIALHEVGHVLGLDHTSNSANVMAGRVRVRSLSSADVATVRLLYRLPPGDLR